MVRRRVFVDRSLAYAHALMRMYSVRVRREMPPLSRTVVVVCVGVRDSSILTGAGVSVRLRYVVMYAMVE